MSPIIHRISVAFLFVAWLPAVMAATTPEIETARAKGLWWLIAHQNSDGRWKSSGGMEIQPTAAAIEAMTNAGVKQGFAYGKAVAWLGNADAPSVDSLARKIMALKGAGVNEKADLDRLLSWKNNTLVASWGAYDKFDTSYPDTPLALGAIRIGQYTYTNQTNNLLNAVYCSILPAQRSDGSWPYIQPSSTTPANTLAGAILPTAYTLLELQAIRAATGWDVNTCGTSRSLLTAINNGVSWLLTKKNSDNNGFGGNGQSTVLETVLAYQVLNLLQPANNATGAALDYLIASQDAATGSWQNDPLQTALVLKTFPATVMADPDKDGIPTAVELLMGTDPAAADGRNLAAGNGQSVAGVTVPLVLASAYLNQPFNFNLTATGGTVPYAWVLTTGTLPIGLGLSGSGVISGTPTSVGDFSFTYTVTDAVGASSTAVGQIAILRAPLAPADGNLNGDSVVDVADVALAERFALGLAVPSATQMAHGDVAPAGNPDGVIDAADVVRIRGKALGLETF